jgi:hypothetical protein
LIGAIKRHQNRHPSQGKKAMKTQQHSEQQQRRIPCPDSQGGISGQGDKGRKHEAFESGNFGCDRRSVARAMRFDRKR